MAELPGEIAHRIEITDAELVSLTTAIKTRFGIDFTCYEKKSLKRGFARLIAKNNLGSLLGLWGKILRDKEFLVQYIDDLLVNLTELFRNPEIWFKIKDDILPKYSSRPVINIWHAGCSTGEEIYSMAIVLKEQSLLHKTRTLATDLSTAALQAAQKASYNKLLAKRYINSYQSYFPGGKAERYFKMTDEEFLINDELKRHIQFRLHNLVQDGSPGKFHIVFCRNVMIYFDDTLKMRVLKLFYDSLEDDGLLIIGYYDMLPEKSKDLFSLYDATTRIYRKNKVNT